MTENEQALLESIEKLANHKKVIELCEPSVISHKTIGHSEVLRVLYAQKLLLEESDKAEAKT